jgi:uncharacterized protein (DUF2164 family)
MSKLDARLSTEIDDLVATGQKFNELVTHSNESVRGEQLAQISMWVTRLGQLVRKLYGEQSQHFCSYKSAHEAPNFYSLDRYTYRQFTQMLGIAQAVKHDITNGLLVDLKSLVQAEVFADFLDMGEHLLNGGYKDAAAVIIGTVLEDGLRRLSVRLGLPTASGEGKSITIDPLNNQLAKHNAYSKLVQKQITTWAHVRNKAAHGEYAEYTKEQVQMMLVFVQSFTAEYLQ